MTRMRLLFFITLFFSLSSLLILRINSKKNDAPSDWKLRISQGNMLFTSLEPSNERMMASVGNGYVATVVGSRSSFISGVYNGPALSVINPSHRARIPSTSNISIKNLKSNFGSALDLERSVFYRRLSVLSENENIVEQRWYAHRTNRYLLVHEIHVNSTATISLELSLDSGPKSNDISFQFIEEMDNFLLYEGAIKVPEDSSSEKVNIAYAFTKVPQNVLVNKSQTLYYITAFRTSLDSENPLKDVVSTYKDAWNHREVLLNEHINGWLQLWSSRIEVEDNLQLAQAINSSLYYILSSIRSDWPFSLSPGGLASDGYNGHVFWDAETWMYPTLLLMYPSLAESMLQYRFNRMKAAQQKASSYHPGYNGTMFPWESAFTGLEVCPTIAKTGLLEQHISGDISFAVQQFWRVSNRTDWLANIGFPLLEGIATFWASRVQKDVHSQYEVNGVIPPDEYAENVDNSVYTNLIAKFSLEFAINAGNVIGRRTPEHWMEIKNNLKILFNQEQQYHPEYDGYKGQRIKQADVVLLGFPLMLDMPAQVRYNDLIYYSEKTDPNGPAMTWSMYCIAWLELGFHDDNVYRVCERSHTNIQPPFNIWTETPNGGTVNFITGAGGFLQGIWAGFAGIRIHENELFVNPHLFDVFSGTSLKFSNVGCTACCLYHYESSFFRSYTILVIV